MSNITSVLEKLSLDIEISDVERVGYSADLSILGVSEMAQKILNQCVILHWFDKEIIADLLSHPDESIVTSVISEISSLTFISELPYGLAFHSLAREGLLNLYKEKRQEVYIECARKVASLLGARKDEASLLEAFYCYIISGKQDEARKIKNQITINTSRTRGVSRDSRVLSLQDEAEKLPFVKPDKIYDILISSNPENKEWVVENLLPRLSRAGMQSAVEYIDADSDELTLLNMQLLARHSKTILTVLTKDWEELSSLANKIIQDNVINQSYSNVVPLIIEERGIPKQLEAFTSINFTNREQNAVSWDRLFQVLGREQQIPVVSSHVSENWFLAHPYPMPSNFTGRRSELETLDGWLINDEDRLFILRALGGFGKSALAWQWINTHVNPAEWTKLVWWSFYEGDASFEHFIEETLKYLKLEVPQGQRPQVDELLKAMQSQKVLLIMDGFERALRAYSNMNAAYQGDEEEKREVNGQDCVNINAEIFLKNVCGLPNIKGKVLMTTRLTPRAVKPHGEFMLGCREEELTAMQKADAIEFFLKQKIKGTQSEIEAACAPYGYHPLSLRLLAGRILKDFENPGDISVAQKLKIDGDLKQHQHHVLEISYNSLPPSERKLLSTIACFRSPVEYNTLQSIAKDVGAIHESPLQDDLHDLVERGLLHFDDKNKKFDLHPIVRHFAYDRLAVAERKGAHERLVNYFETVPQSEKTEQLEDLTPVIELYHHMVRAGKLDEAFVLFRDRLSQPVYYQFGAYQLIVELLLALFPDGNDKLPHLQDESAQAWTLNTLAIAYSLGGQPHRAASLFTMQNELREKAADKINFVIGLGNVAQIQLSIGALRDAEHNLRRSIDLCREIREEFWEGIGHQELGRILSSRGEMQEAEQELVTGLKLFEKQNAIQSEGIIWLYRSLRLLLMARTTDHSSTLNLKLAIQSASQALELVNVDARKNYPKPRDYVRTYWLLGATYRVNADLNKAEENLAKAITICRQINDVENEADILLDLARLRYDQKNYEEAKSLAEEALLITERCGYVLQGADVNLFLAQYALEQEKDKVKAREYAETALKLATCDGPPYYYKVAYEEAERMLEGL